MAVPPGRLGPDYTSMPGRTPAVRAQVEALARYLTQDPDGLFVSLARLGVARIKKEGATATCASKGQPATSLMASGERSEWTLRVRVRP